MTDLWIRHTFKIVRFEIYFPKNYYWPLINIDSKILDRFKFFIKFKINCSVSKNIRHDLLLLGWKMKVG